MAERIRWMTDFCAASCIHCDYFERATAPGPDDQKKLLRHARQHALRTGHRVSIERGQLAGVEA